MKQKYKLIGALCVNALIVVFEVIAFVLSWIEHGFGSFLFYTQDSNYFAMAVSFLFCVYGIKELRGKGVLPEWIDTIRYISVSCLMVTFFVVIFILMPMIRENPFIMLYGGSMLYQHTLCPVLAALSFLIFEIRDRLPKTDLIKALIPTLIYAVIAIILNLCKIIEGPYFFLMVYAQPWYMSVIWCIVVLGLAGFFAFILWSLHNFICKKTNSIRRSRM